MPWRWCAAREAITVFLVRLITESHRGGLFPASCSMCAIRKWLWKVLGEDIARDEVGEAVQDQFITFYVDDGLVITRCCPEWLQSRFSILINLFTNAEKTKVMMCLPGMIQASQTEEEYTSQQMGLGITTTKHQHVDCKVCWTSLVAESPRSHLETQHNILQSFVLNRDIIVVREPEVYHATKLPATSIYFSPLSQCGGQPGNRNNLRHLFHLQHPQDLGCIPIGRLPCGL